MSRSRFFSKNVTTDSDLYLKNWFAFNGSAGDLIATSCVESNHCGTSVPGWMLGRHPSVVEGVVRRFACFSQKQQCCMYSVSMRVRNCSSFYVYKLDSMPSSSVSFRMCGAGIKGTANAIWTNLHLLFRSKSFLTSFVKFKLFVPVNTRKHLLNNFNNWRRLAIQNLQKQ